MFWKATNQRERWVNTYWVISVLTGGANSIYKTILVSVTEAFPPNRCPSMLFIEMARQLVEISLPFFPRFPLFNGLKTFGEIIRMFSTASYQLETFFKWFI